MRSVGSKTNRARARLGKRTNAHQRLLLLLTQLVLDTVHVKSGYAVICKLAHDLSKRLPRSNARKTPQRHVPESKSRCAAVGVVSPYRNISACVMTTPVYVRMTVHSGIVCSSAQRIAKQSIILRTPVGQVFDAERRVVAGRGAPETLCEVWAVPIFWDAHVSVSEPTAQEALMQGHDWRAA